MPAQFDDNQWPLVVVRMLGADSNADVEAMLAGLARRIARGRCAVVFDTSQMIHPALAQAQENVRLEGQWLRARQSLLRTNLLGVAFIITSPVVRFALSSVLLIAPLPAQHMVTGELLEGRNYCLQLLRTPASRS